MLPDDSSRTDARANDRQGHPGGPRRGPYRSPGLLAQVAIAKIDDHLPLYRQTEIYARSGVHIPRSSMAQWLGICGVRLAPLGAALKDFVLGHEVIHVDETPVSLLAPGRGKTKKAYVWV